MCFNIGVIIGPLLSGFLADPIRTLPWLVGPGSLLGGTDGIEWLRKFPYALPNLFCSTILGVAAVGVMLGLDETHPKLRHRVDLGRRLGKLLLRKILRRPSDESEYQSVSSGTTTESLDLIEADEAAAVPDESEPKTQTSFRELWTRNVTLNMLQRFLQSLHVSSFNSILFTLLPTPRANSNDFDLPFHFAGGLGLSSEKMGFANTTIGMIGIPLQLVVYPRLIGKLGVRHSYKVFLPLSILAYFSLPYLVLLPDNIALIWTCLSAVLTMHVLSRTFVNPATMLLVNECAPSPDLLGTIHGLASSVSSAARIMGPTIGGSLLGWGLSHNMVGLPLWSLGSIAVANWVVLFWIEEVKIED